MKKLTLILAVLAALGVPAVAQAHWQLIFLHHRGVEVDGQLMGLSSTEFVVMPGTTVIGEQTVDGSVWMRCTNPATYRLGYWRGLSGDLGLRVTPQPVRLRLTNVTCGRGTRRWFEPFPGLRLPPVPARGVNPAYSFSVRERLLGSKG